MHRGEHRQDLLPNPEAFDPAGIEIAPSLIRCATLSHASKRASQLPLLGPHSPDNPEYRILRRPSAAASVQRVIHWKARALRHGSGEADRLDDRGVVVLWLVDARADRPHPHRLGWEW